MPRLKAQSCDYIALENKLILALMTSVQLILRRTPSLQLVLYIKMRTIERLSCGTASAVFSYLV